VPATTPALFPDIFPRSQFNSSPLRVSRHPHIQSWITFPLSHPPPQLHPLLALVSPFFPRSQDHTCHLISASTHKAPITSLGSQDLSISNMDLPSHFPFLASTVAHSPHLNSTRLVFCFPSSPHWVSQHTLQSSHVLTADCYACPTRFSCSVPRYVHLHLCLLQL
jgi:hypothetical protein